MNVWSRGWLLEKIQTTPAFRPYKLLTAFESLLWVNCVDEPIYTYMWVFGQKSREFEIHKRFSPTSVQLGLPCPFISLALRETPSTEDCWPQDIRYQLNSDLRRTGVVECVRMVYRKFRTSGLSQTLSICSIVTNLADICCDRAPEAKLCIHQRYRKKNAVVKELF